MNNNEFKSTDISKYVFTSEVVLGQGSYGTVYKGKLENYGEVIRKDIQDFDSIMKEIKVLERIRESNFCNTYFLCLVGKYNGVPYDYKDHNTTIYFFYIKYVPNCHNMDKYLFDMTKKIKLEQKLALTYSLLSAFTQLHRMSIVHLDIKLANILFCIRENDAGIKIIDYGLSCISDDAKCMLYLQDIGYVWYFPPELFTKAGMPLIEDEDYNTLIKKIESIKIDSFQLGLVLYTIFTKEFLLSEDFEMNIYVLKEVKYGDILFNMNIPFEIAKIITNLLDLNVSERWTIERAFEYFKNMYKDKFNELLKGLTDIVEHITSDYPQVYPRYMETLKDVDNRESLQLNREIVNTFKKHKDTNAGTKLDLGDVKEDLDPDSLENELTYSPEIQEVEVEVEEEDK